MFSRVAIVGLGVIGGSVGYAVRRAWPDVPRIGVDTPAVLAEALKHGAITEARNSAAGLEAADLIVLATPVMQIVQQIQELARAGTSATVTDVGSTKRAVLAAAARAQLRTFVGGHPMSGAAGAGLTHAREDLFDGCRWILVPEAAPSLAAFVTSLGADPHGMDAVSHDRVMAYVSHAPQVMASALAAAAHEAVGDAGLASGGRGFADMTRLASSAAGVWRDILATNADFVHEAITAITGRLPNDAAALADAGVVDGLFARANAARARFDARS